MNAKPTREAEDAMSVVPAEIRELLEQRGTYREWLRRLDEVGSQYRSDVAERVRADYRARLEGVGDELEKHRHELVSTLDGRRGRLDELSRAFERRSAELEEAELRFQVGEFDDAVWDEKRAELTEGLEEIEGDLDGQRSAVEELERVLDELSSGGGRPASQGAASSAAAAEPVAAPTGSATTEAAEEVDEDEDANVAAAREEAPAAEEPEVAVEAEVADLEPEPAMGEMDAGERKDAAAEATASPDPAETAEPPSDDEDAAGGDADEDYMDELEFLESLSLDDPDSFDAVSRMLEDEEDR